MNNLTFPTLLAVGLQPVDYAIMVGYMCCMLAMGWYLSRKQVNIEDFFVGGRTMPWLATGMSMIATLMSTLSYLGSPGEMIKHGVAQFVAILALPFVFIVVWTLWVPFFMRLRLTSAYEYLEMRFGPKARLLGAVLYLYMRFLWMGAIIYSASIAVAHITQDTAPGAIASLTGGAIRFDAQSWFYFVLISTGVVSTAYTVLGGISAVIWTDVVQMFFLFLGAVVTLIVVAAKTGTGPLVWWQEVTSISHEFPPLASWDLSQRNTILWSLLGVFFWQICTHASDQVALQRYFSNVDVRAARKTAMVGIFLDITMQTLLGMVGAALLVYYMRNPDRLPAGVDSPMTTGFSDRIFPHFINYGLPVGISGFVVAAIFAVAQSSIDSGINATSSVIMIDLVRKYRRNQSSEAQDLKLAKILTVCIGVVVTLMGVALSLAPKDLNLIDLQLKSFNCVLGPLGAMFMAGMLLRHVGQTPVVIAGITGAVCGLMFGFMDVLFTPLVQSLTGSETLVVRCPSPFLVIPLSWLVTFMLSALLGGFFPGPTLDQVRRYTWAGIFYGSKENV
jgi:solute:Na+ symporter, SSS family